MTTKRKNARSLDAIADDINKLERVSIFEIGDLLIEAKAQCEHGEWLDWLDAEFDWSVDKAELLMQVAHLGTKFRNFRNLKLAKTTLYELAGSDYDDDVLGAIVAELAKHATGTKLRACDAGRVIQIGIGRHRHGDHPDATLLQLIENDNYSEESWYQKVVEALKKRDPETDEDAVAIVYEVQQEHLEAERKAHEAALLRKIDDVLAEDEAAEREAEAILDGPPPDLPSPTTPPEPQKLGAETAWTGTGLFEYAVRNLLGLRAKPAGRFVGMFSPTELREVADFLMAVAAAGEKAKAEIAPTAPETKQTTTTGDDGLGIPAFLDRRHEEATA